MKNESEAPEARRQKGKKTLAESESADTLTESETTRRAAHEGWAFPLLRRHGIYLQVFNGTGSERFCRLFRETWRRIPLAVRRRMLTYWRQGNDLKPTFRLSHELREPGRRSPYACADRAGHRLVFDPKLFGAMPDPIACDLIAHELAHVWQFATGWLEEEEMVELHGMSMEAHADECMEDWGFSPNAIDEWGVSVGRGKVNHVTAVGAIVTRLHFLETGQRNLPRNVLKKYLVKN